MFHSSHARPLPTTNLSQHVYDYSKANFPEINSYIFNSNILNCLHFCDVETSWAIIKSVIYEAMTLFIPKFRVYSKQYPKWFTKELRHQIKCLHTLRRNYKRSPSDHNATHLNQAENSFQINADTAKSNYETNRINNFVSTSNPAIYRHIRSYFYQNRHCIKQTQWLCNMWCHNLCGQVVLLRGARPLWSGPRLGYAVVGPTLWNGTEMDYTTKHSLKLKIARYHCCLCPYKS